MYLIAYAFKGQVHVFAGQVKIVNRSSCRTHAIFKYFCPLDQFLILVKTQFYTPLLCIGFIAPDKAAYCVFTQFRGPENAIKLISVRTKTQ